MSTIKIDWDKKRPPDCGGIALVISQLQLDPFSIRYTRSQSHWHVIIETECKLPAVKIIALQLLLGSDPHRELYNLYRVLAVGASRYWRQRWNVLFKAHNSRRKP